MLWSVCPSAHAFFGIGPADQPQQQRDRGNLPCALITTPYELHLITYLADQPSHSGTTVGYTPYCSQLPAVGKVHFVLDLLDRKLRDFKISVQIDQKQATDTGNPPLVRLPARRYPQGFVEGDVEIFEPGQYVFTAYFRNEREDEILRVPIHAGTSVSSASVWGTGALLAVLATLVITLRGRK